MAGAEYTLGDKKLAIESLGIEVEYKVIVACPATKSLSSATVEHKTHMCPDLLQRNIYNPDRLWEMPWNEDDKPKVRQTDFFEVAVTDEWPYCPLPASIVHALHIGAREDLPEMYILSKVNMYAYVTVFGGPKVTTPHTVNGYTIDIDHHNDWPDHAISYNGLVYINEGLKAAYYAAAGCPLYKKPGDNFWSFNKAEITARYIESGRWHVTANWLGVPEGEGALGIKHKVGKDEYVTVSYPVSSAYLKFNGPDTVHVKMEADPQCVVQYCKEASMLSAQTIDVVTKHATTSRTVMAMSSVRLGAPCLLVTADGAEHYAISGKPTQINTRASRISAANTVACPEPEDGFDDTYGSLMDKLTAKDPNTGPLAFLDNLLPDMGKMMGKIQKIIPIVLACLTVYVLGINQAGLVAGAAVYVALAGIPGALAYTDGEVLVKNYDPVLMLMYALLEKKVVLIVSLITFIVTIKKQDVDERFYKAAIYIILLSEGPRSVKLLLVGFLLAMMSFWARTFFSTRIAEFNDFWEHYYVKATYAISSIPPLLGDAGFEQHSTASTYVRKPCIKKYIEQPSKVIIATPGRRVYTNTLPRWRKSSALEAAARHNIRNMRGWILYEREYDNLASTLTKLTDREIERFYDFCIRVHGRREWDLEDFMEEVPLHVHDEVREIWLKHGTEYPS